MQRNRRWLVLAGLLAAALQLSACTQQTAEADGATSEPATVEHVAGSDVSRLTLTAQAVERLGIETTPVRRATVEGQARTVVPYGAVLYDATGKTWVYVIREHLSYLREQITVDDIEGQPGGADRRPARRHGGRERGRGRAVRHRVRRRPLVGRGAVQP